MEDKEIIELYFARSEEAIGETARKYGAYCRTIAGRILPNAADAEECVSDTWLRAWGAIPPNRPERLGAFLGKITRNLALDRFLAGLPPKKRKLCLRRYWYFSPVEELARDFGMSESGVKMALLRLRRELKEKLKQEGIDP